MTETETDLLATLEEEEEEELEEQSQKLRVMYLIHPGLKYDKITEESTFANFRGCEEAERHFISCTDELNAEVLNLRNMRSFEPVVGADGVHLTEYGH